MTMKEGHVLFNDTLNTFYLRLYGIRHMVKDHSDLLRERKPAAATWVYSFRLAARVLLYASSHRQDNTYHGLCYTSRGALAGTRNSPMGPPWRIISNDPSHHERTLLPRSYISLPVMTMMILQNCLKGCYITDISVISVTLERDIAPWWQWWFCKTTLKDRQCYLRMGYMMTTHDFALKILHNRH